MNVWVGVIRLIAEKKVSEYRTYYYYIIKLNAEFGYNLLSLNKVNAWSYLQSLFDTTNYIIYICNASGRR